MAGRLDGKVAIVTGASSGIGRAIAILFAKEGAKVTVSDVVEKPLEGGKPTAEIIVEGKGKAIFVKTDVSSAGQVQEMVRKTVAEFGGVDILVNNAGIYKTSSVTDMKEEDWDMIMDVNLKGIFLCSKAAINQMLKQGRGGKVINISSIAGLVGFGQSAAYCASKGGVAELTREMALDYAKHKINVNAINPGVIKTAMTEEMLENEEMKKFLDENTPWPRLGEPEDIAYAALYLASEESDFVTGHNLVVDGGWTAR